MTLQNISKIMNVVSLLFESQMTIRNIGDYLIILEKTKYGHKLTTIGPQDTKHYTDLLQIADILYTLLKDEYDDSQ